MKQVINNNYVGGGGVGVCSLLGITFVILKLCGVLDWSWWWVLAPFWIPLALVVVIVLIIVIIGVLIDTSK